MGGPGPQPCPRRAANTGGHRAEARFLGGGRRPGPRTDIAYENRKAGRAGGANASRWASTRPGDWGWGWARSPGARRARRRAAGAGGCRSWRPPAGAAGRAGARRGRRAGTRRRRGRGPVGGRRPLPRSPMARPTASSLRAASGAGAAALAVARGSGCGGCGGQGRPRGPALSLRRREGPFRGGAAPAAGPRSDPARAPSRASRHIEGLIASDQ